MLRIQKVLSLVIIAIFCNLSTTPTHATTCWTENSNAISAASSCSGLIVIPSGITRIENSAFENSTVTQVTLPSSLLSIGTSAFLNVRTLQTVNFESATSLTSIGDNAFNSTAIRSVQFNDALTSLGIGSFYGVESMTSLTFGSGLTSIPDGAFTGTRITTLNIPSAITSIGVSAFDEVSTLETLTLSSSLQSIGFMAFYHTGVKNLILPNSLTSLGAQAFDGAPLESLILGSGISSIPNQAFYGSNLTSLVIPANIRSIGDSAFHGNPLLTNITLTDYLESIGTNAFSGAPILATVTTRVESNARIRSEAAKVASRTEIEAKARIAISNARNNVLEKLKNGSVPTRSNLLASSFPGINQNNVMKLEVEIARFNLATISISDIELLAKKVVVIESVSGNTKTAKRTSTQDLALIGIPGMESPFKITILYKIVTEPLENRATYDQIKDLAKKFLAQSNSRNQRLASAIAKIRSK